MRSASSRFTHVTMIITTHAIIIKAELQMRNTFTSQVSGSISNSNTKASGPSTTSTISL